MTWDFAWRLVGAFAGGIALASLFWGYRLRQLLAMYQSLIQSYEEMRNQKNEYIAQLEMNLGALRFAIRTGMLVKAEERSKNE